MPEPLLEIEALGRVFETRGRRVVALDRCTLAIPARTTYALVGESGSGKSTLANLVVGLDRPTQGRIALGAAKLSSVRTLDQRRRIGFVQQNPFSSLNPRHSISSAIEMPLIVHGYGNSRRRRERVFELLDLVGLSADLASRLPRALSGGQRQRVAIARAIALEPDLVVLDEPTSALDVSVQARILGLLVELQARLGLTYLLITHDLGVVRVLSHRIGVLYRGRLLEEADTDLLFREPQHPYTNLLLSSVPTVLASDDLVKPAWPATVPGGNVDIAAGCNFRDRCPFREDKCATLPDDFFREAVGHGSRCIRSHEEWLPAIEMAEASASTSQEEMRIFR